MQIPGRRSPPCTRQSPSAKADVGLEASWMSGYTSPTSSLNSAGAVATANPGGTSSLNPGRRRRRWLLFGCGGSSAESEGWESVRQLPSAEPGAVGEAPLLPGLAALLSKPGAAALRALGDKGDEGTGARSSLPLEGGAVLLHHWPLGLALTCVGGAVDEVEVFCDRHPFQQRPPGRQLLPGVSFGSCRAAVEAALGPPIGEGSGCKGGWLFYGPWRLPGRKKRGLVTLALWFGEGAAGGGGGPEAGGPGRRTELDPESGGGGRRAPPGAEAERVGGACESWGGLQAVRLLRSDDRSLWRSTHAVREASLRTADACIADAQQGEAGRGEAEAGGAEEGPQWRWLRNRRFNAATNAFIQVAGHSNLFERLCESVIIKQSSTPERAAYEGISATPLGPFVPRCLCACQRGEVQLLYIEDLTARYRRPCVMDVKVGTRTFLEADAASTRRRVDLALKMLAVDPAALSEEEAAAGVTKMEYMRWREVTSSSATLGWRIEGIRRARGGAAASHYPAPKLLREPEQLEQAVGWFCEGRPAVRRAFAARLAELRAALEASRWFATHELVSSSLLLLYDGDPHGAAPPGLWMIDFAKAAPLDGALVLTHRAPWQPGNCEDGYLTGVDSLLHLLSRPDPLAGECNPSGRSRPSRRARGASQSGAERA